MYGDTRTRRDLALEVGGCYCVLDPGSGVISELVHRFNPVGNLSYNSLNENPNISQFTPTIRKAPHRESRTNRPPRTNHMQLLGVNHAHATFDAWSLAPRTCLGCLGTVDISCSGDALSVVMILLETANNSLNCLGYQHEFTKCTCISGKRYLTC